MESSSDAQSEQLPGFEDHSTQVYVRHSTTKTPITLRCMAELVRGQLQKLLVSARQLSCACCVLTFLTGARERHRGPSPVPGTRGSIEQHCSPTG